jgi:AraC-like DNA-binding protein
MGIIQGFIFGFTIIFSKKYYSKTNLFLSYTSFALSISNLQYFLIDCHVNLYLPFLDWLRIPTEFLIIPMFYIFVNLYLELKITHKQKFLLTIPFIISTLFQFFIFINNYFYFQKNFNEKLIYNYFIIEEISSFSFSFLLIIKTFLIIKKYKFENVNYSVEKVVAKTKWIKQILFIGLFSCFFWIIGIYLMNIAYSFKNFSIYYPIWLCISFIIYWLSYSGLIQSIILLERKEIRLEIIKNKKIFNPEKTNLILNNFEVYIKENIQNPNLSLEIVAEKLNVSPNYLSQIINSMEIKFNDYINKLRIEGAIKMINDKKFSQYTITSIGLEAGFNSNASFYRAFRKHTGKSPKEYKTK